MLAVYALIAAAISTIVVRRIGESSAGIAAGLVGAFILVLGLSHFAEAVASVRRWILIRRAAGGGQPEDGKACAVLGRIEAVGGRVLRAPLSGRQAVAYSYEILALDASNRHRKWEGAEVAPCGVRTASGLIRLHAQPKLAFRKERLRGPDVVARATEYLDSPADLNRALFTEQVVAPGDMVIAVGVYSLAQRALVDPIRLEEEGDARRSPGRRFASSMMNGVVFTALAVAALTALLAIVPLTAPRPLGAEIAVENFLDQRVRPQITRLEIIPFVPATDRLQPGEARGLIGREVITSVTALSKEGGTELQLRSERDLVVMVVEVGRDQVTAIRVLDQPVDLSSVRFDLHADDGRWQGRITWQNGHVVLVAP